MKSSNDVPPGTHTWVVDQLTDQTVTVEVDGVRTMTVPAWLLPRNVSEGDVLRVKHDRRTDRSICMIVADDEERRRRLAQSEAQLNVRSKYDRPGDVTL